MDVAMCPYIKWNQTESNAASHKHLDLFWLTCLVWNKELLPTGFYGQLRLGFCCLVFKEIRSPNYQLAEREAKCWEVFEDCAKERKHVFPDENGHELWQIFFFFSLKVEGCCGTQPDFNMHRLKVPLVLTDPHSRGGWGRCARCPQVLGAGCAQPGVSDPRTLSSGVLSPHCWAPHFWKGDPWAFVLRGGLGFCFNLLWIFQ